MNLSVPRSAAWSPVSQWGNGVQPRRWRWLVHLASCQLRLQLPGGWPPCDSGRRRTSKPCLRLFRQFWKHPISFTASLPAQVHREFPFPAPSPAPDKPSGSFTSDSHVSRHPEDAHVWVAAPTVPSAEVVLPHRHSAARRSPAFQRQRPIATPRPILGLVVSTLRFPSANLPLSSPGPSPTLGHDNHPFSLPPHAVPLRLNVAH